MANSLPNRYDDDQRDDTNPQEGRSNLRQRIEYLEGRLRPGQSLASKSIRYLLLLRFGVVNLMACALLAAAFLQGWVGMLIAAESTGLCFLIVAVFGLGWVICAAKIVRVSREMNRAKEFDPLVPVPSLALNYVAAVQGRSAQSRSTLANGLQMKFSSRLAVVRQIANSLVFLGLIGTVIGFISRSRVSSPTRCPT